MIKLFLVGYGKMGKAVEAQALKQNDLTIIGKNNGDVPLENEKELANADVVVEFTQPDSGYANVKYCIEQGIPTVTGTTGWGDRLMEIKDLADDNKIGFLHANNFSLGVNLFEAMVSKASQLMHAHRSHYEVAMKEVHHTEKKDSPSGTAIWLAESIMQQWPELKGWIENDQKEKELSIYTAREKDVPGTHSVIFKAAMDQITLEHKAYNREGFAAGALLAARFVITQKGHCTMRNVLGIN